MPEFEDITWKPIWESCTADEWSVVKLILKGFTVEETATQLNMAPDEIRETVKRVYDARIS